MKQKHLTRIFAFLLAIVCVLGLVACKKDYEETTATTADNSGVPADTVTYMTYVLTKSAPTKAVSVGTYTAGENVLDFTSTLQVKKSSLGTETKYAYSYEKFNEPGADEMIGTVSDVVYSQNDMIAAFGDDGNTAWGSYTGTVSLGNFKLPTDAAVSHSGENYTLTATVPAASAASVFGSDIGASGSISLKLTTAGSKLASCEISYTAVSGATVSLTCTYTYNTESFSVTNPNA